MQKLPTVFLFVTLALVQSATVPPSANPYFPTAEAIYLEKAGQLTIRIEKEQLVITEDRQHERQLFKNLSRHASESVYYSELSPIRHIEAETLTQKKGKIKSVTVDEFETEDVMQPGIFYGGYRRKTCTYPALAAGVTTALRYTKTITEPRLIAPFYFNDQLPVLRGTFSVICDSAVDLGYQLYGTSETDISFQKETVGAQVKYTWSASKLPALVHEADAPSHSHWSPHVVVFVKSFRVGQHRRRVSTDLSDLYAWYTQLTNQMSTSESPEAVDRIVASLVKTSTDRRETIQRIYQWVQQNIKYVAFEDGMEGFIPRPAGEVLTKRYGDCKDMANLLKAMLHAAGIEGHLTWIGTRKKPYSYRDVPTTVADNHMICAVREGDTYLFLDATSAHVPFGFPTSMIQGKEALVALDQRTYDLVEVPVVPRTKNARRDSVVLRLAAEGLSGNHYSVLNGYRAEAFAYGKTMTPVESHDDFLRTYYDVGNGNAVISRIDIKKAPHQQEVSFAFELPDYGRQVGDQWYVNLNIHKTLPGELVDTDTRQHLVENEYQYENHQKILLPIPQGYVPSYLPDNQSFVHADFGFDIRYTVENDIIVLEKQVYIDSLTLEQEHFSDWNAMLTSLMQAYQETLVLTRHNQH